MNALAMVSGPLLIAPAYGRKYHSKDDARQDWQAGKDFRILPAGPYCSIRDRARMLEDFSSIFVMISNGVIFQLEAENA